MSDVTFALAAKSDQLNAVNIIGGPRVIRIRDVAVAKREQPVWVYFDGDDGKPWKPSKGMLRVLAAVYGQDSSGWIGKRVKLRYEPTVMYAGQQVGGIQIAALEGLPPGETRAFSLRLAKSKTTKLEVAPLPPIGEYPEGDFKEKLPAMKRAINDGKMTVGQVIAHCEKTGKLSDSQKAKLKEVKKDAK